MAWLYESFFSVIQDENRLFLHNFASTIFWLKYYSIILTCLFLLQLAIIQLQQIVGKYLLTSDVSLVNPWKLRHFENWLQKHLKLGRHFVTWPLTLSNIWWFCVWENLIKFLKKQIFQHSLALDSFLNQAFGWSNNTKSWWKSNLFGNVCLNFVLSDVSDDFT